MGNEPGLKRIVAWLALAVGLYVAGYFFLFQQPKPRQVPLPPPAPEPPVVQKPSFVMTSAIMRATERYGGVRPQIRKKGGVPAASTDKPARPVEPGGVSSPDAIAGEFVLCFKSDQDRAAFLERARAKGLEVLDVMPFAFSVLVRAGKRQDLQAVVAEGPAPADYSSNLYVLAPEIPEKKTPMQKPPGEYRGFGERSLKWLGVPEDNGAWGRGVTVAVMDGGVEAHPLLKEENITRVNLLGGADASAESGYSGHGTAVASILAGAGSEVKGMAPSATLLSVQVMNRDGVGDTFTLAKGIVEAVDRGAAVINCCLGTESDSYILRQAVEYAVRKGVVLVAAAGNDGVEGVEYPGRYDGVLAVSAVDADGRFLYFSNRGKEVGLAAPGIGVAAGWTGGKVVSFSGTSAAVPFVSGALAALLSQNPGLTAAEAVDLLKRYSDDAGVPHKDQQFGDGILDMKRVVERDTQGIYDIALGDLFVERRQEGQKTPTAFLISAQNRGTERLPDVELRAEIDGKTQPSVHFQDVTVGQTVSHAFPFRDLGPADTVTARVVYSVLAAGVEDVRPMNNSREAVVVVTGAGK